VTQDEDEADHDLAEHEEPLLDLDQLVDECDCLQDDCDSDIEADNRNDLLLLQRKSYKLLLSLM